MRPISSSVVVLSGMLLLPVLLLPNMVMTSSLYTMEHWRHGDVTSTDKVSANESCSQSESPRRGLTLRCSGRRLTQVPVSVPNMTVRLFLDKNLLGSVPANSFSDLWLLAELDLSHNQISLLEAGCFSGLDSSLRFLDLSSNRLTTLDLLALGGLRVHANLTCNPWHCDCKLQVSMPQLDLDPASLADVVCLSSDLPNLGAAGMPLVLLVEDWDLCLSVRRSTDVLMLVIMFLWFCMLLSYLLYYVRQNQEHFRRHMAYLKLLQSREA